MGRLLSYEPKDVILQFLEEERTGEERPIQFVVTFSVVHPNQLDLRFCRIDISHYVLDSDYNPRIDMRPVLTKLQKVLPVPERNAVNAINLLKRDTPNQGASFWGGVTMGETKVKLPARALLELLAGRVSQEDFFKAHLIEIGQTPHHMNPFRDAINGGRLISKISIEKDSDADDDWITIELRGPDPAVSPFVLPKDLKK
jgi:hypothetical protein